MFLHNVSVEGSQLSAKSCSLSKLDNCSWLGSFVGIFVLSPASYQQNHCVMSETIVYPRDGKREQLEKLVLEYNNTEG